MEKIERKQLKERLLKMVVNEPRLESMPPITMAEVIANSMSKPNLEPLLDFISEELDKAREEGKREAFTKDEWFMLKLAMNDIFNKGNTAYEEISEKIEELSKLKDNK